MLTSGKLAAYTLRLFDSHTGDEDMERVFERAVNHASAMILLEDIDRAFPRTGESKGKVSLQRLLNCLDGVATGEGIVTVATANEPTILDPAILRRPGRFDRVVHFPNPSALLRREYFCRMHKHFAAIDLDLVVTDSEGFSFAQLREAYIMAGHLAFEGSREICMATACFEQSTIVQIEGSEHRLSRKIDDCWQLEHSKTGRIVEYTQQDLLRMTAEQTLTFPGTVSIYRGEPANRDLSLADLELAKLRRSYVLAVLDIPNSRIPLEEATTGPGRGSSHPRRLQDGSVSIGGSELF